MKRFGTILAAASGSVCVLLLLLFPVSHRLHVWSYDKLQKIPVSRYFIALPPHLYVRCLNGGLWFSNHELPYMGGLRHLSDAQGALYDGNHHARVVHESPWHLGKNYGFDRTTYIGEKNEWVGTDTGLDLPGVYFRRFIWWKEAGPEWTLMVSLWYPVLFFAVAPAVWSFRRLRRKKS